MALTSMNASADQLAKQRLIIKQNPAGHFVITADVSIERPIPSATFTPIRAISIQRATKSPTTPTASGAKDAETKGSISLQLNTGKFQ